MSSKAFLLLVLSLSIFLAIASEAAARDLAEVASTNGKPNGVADQYGGGGRYPGRGGNPGSGYPGGGYPGGGRGHGGYCRYGCCRRGYYGRCFRCCAYKGEAVETVTEAKPHT